MDDQLARQAGQPAPGGSVCQHAHRRPIQDGGPRGAVAGRPRNLWPFSRPAPASWRPPLLVPAGAGAGVAEGAADLEGLGGGEYPGGQHGDAEGVGFVQAVASVVMARG